MEQSNRIETQLTNKELRDFAQEVTQITNLELNGELTSEEAYNHIKNLWEELKVKGRKRIDE